MGNTPGSKKSRVPGSTTMQKPRKAALMHTDHQVCDTWESHQKQNRSSSSTIGIRAARNYSHTGDESKSLPTAGTKPLWETHGPGRPDPLDFVHRNLKQHVDEIHSERENWESEPIELHEEPEESVPNSAVSTEPLRTPETAVPPGTATNSVLEETEEKSSRPDSLSIALQDAMNYVNNEDDIAPKFGSPGPMMYSEYDYSDLLVEPEESDLKSTVLKPLQTPEKTVSPKTVTSTFVSTNDTVFEETKEEPDSLDFLMKQAMDKHFNKDESDPKSGQQRQESETEPRFKTSEMPPRAGRE